MPKPASAAVRNLVTLRVRLLHRRLVDCTAGACKDCKRLALATEALVDLLPAGQARLVRNLEATQELARWGYLPEEVLHG